MHQPNKCDDGLWHQKTLHPHSIYIYKCSKCMKTMDTTQTYLTDGTPITYYDLAHIIHEWP